MKKFRKFRKSRKTKHCGKKINRYQYTCNRFKKGSKLFRKILEGDEKDGNLLTEYDSLSRHKTEVIRHNIIF